MCTSGCQNSFARCFKIPPGFCEREQFLNFDDCCTNTNGCCNGFPVTWPPRPEIKPVLICRDCGCKFEMYQYADDCFPPSPDFSQVVQQGYQLEIDQPNACNEIYFHLNSNRCIPPRVCCTCPLCRRRSRVGDHFCDCTCILCNSRRANCLNRLRRQLLKEHRKPCPDCGRKHVDIPPCCVPLPKEKCEPKPNEESNAPRDVQVNCPCHLFTPTNWEILERCSRRLQYEGEVIRKEKEAQEKTKNEMKEKRTGIWKVLTDSLSQLTWELGPPPCQPCPDAPPCPPELCDENSPEDADEDEDEENYDDDEFEDDEDEEDDDNLSMSSGGSDDDYIDDLDGHPADDTPDADVLNDNVLDLDEPESNS